MKHQLVVVKDMQVVAETPHEMRKANQSLIEWCKHKIDEVKADYIELEASWKSALEKKWKHTTLKRHAELAKKRINFYEKIKKALELGFYIIPSFPVTVFAIRSNRQKPLKLLTTSQWHTHENKANTFPEGEGEYKNPLPEIYERDITTPDEKLKGKTIKQYWGEKWEAIDFPINMAKPRIMDVTTRAMALKLFDDFGVLPGPHRKIDPLIIARIRDPRSPNYGEPRTVNFIIAWALDTKSL